MVKKSAWLATLVALVCGTSARADFFSQLATVNQVPAGGTTAVPMVRQLNGSGNGGASYGNNFSSSAPAPGDDIRIVGADRLTFYNIVADGTPPVNFGNNQVVGVFALDARVL